MTTKWVGWTTCMVLLAATIGAGGATAEYEERFNGGDDTPWVAVSGNITFESTHGSQGDLLDYVKVEGDGTGSLPFAHTHVDPAIVNTTLTGYELDVQIERDGDHGSGWFGITFGQSESDGYLAGFDDDEFFLADISSGSLMTFYSEDTTDKDLDLDKRLRYTLSVAGDLVKVDINGFPLLTANLPTTASGHFGLAAETGTTIHSQKVIYRIFDETPPNLQLFRPQDNTLYLEDNSFNVPTGGAPIVIGEFTLGADVVDIDSGVDNALLMLNGQYIAGTKTTETGPETAWTIDTSDLPSGFHTITVRAKDNNGNIAESSTTVLVLSSNITTGTVGAVEEVVENLIP